MRVLAIGADRAKQGILHQGSAVSARQKAYAEVFGTLDIVGFSRRGEASAYTDRVLSVYPTRSRFRRWYARDAVRIARALPKPAVVTTQDPFETGLTALRIARYFGVPLHVQVHTDFLSPQYRTSLLGMVRRIIAGYVIRRAARIRVVSERIKESLIQKYRLKAPISVLPIYVDVAKFASTVPDAALYKRFEEFSRIFLFVGRLEREKNCALAIRSFAIAANPDDCLIIIGDGSEHHALNQLADEFGVSDRVFFEGTKDPAPYYKRADLLLVTSKYEGYGLVIIEALASGTPVLSTDVGVARESGALVADEEHYGDALKQWIKSGPREGMLRSYPYTSFEQYVQAYCDDIRSCVHER